MSFRIKAIRRGEISSGIRPNSCTHLPAKIHDSYGRLLPIGLSKSGLKQLPNFGQGMALIGQKGTIKLSNRSDVRSLTKPLRLFLAWSQKFAGIGTASTLGKSLQVNILGL